MFDTYSKILVIDDMQTMRNIVSRNLKSLGYLKQASDEDGDQAWELIQAEEIPFDIIVSDWNMPNCSGLELLKRVRGDARFEKTVFILLTAESEITQVQEALQAGVDNYIVKPFSPQQLEKKFFDTFNRTAARFGRQKAKKPA